MKKLGFLFLLIGILSSCTKKNDNIVENAHNNGIIWETNGGVFQFENPEKINGETSLNKMDTDIAIWNNFLGGDLGNIKYGIVTPGNSLSLEDWKKNNNESERIKIFFERFCGYYINVVDFGIVKIAKLSIGGDLDKYLILQRVSLTDDGFVEGNEFILDDIEVDDVVNYISLDPTHYDYHRFYLTYLPKSARHERYDDLITMNYRNDQWDSSNNFHTKNINELGAIVGSIFSIETQKKYTGRFVFQEYEYYESYYRDGDTAFKELLEQIKEETEQMTIEVNIDENGYLFVSGIRNDSSLIDKDIRNILITDNGRRIYDQSGDGTFRSMSLLFYFLNEDAIISEYSSYTGDEYEKYTSLDYKVKYIKTGGIYE
jgi:hypothetical protein